MKKTTKNILTLTLTLALTIASATVVFGGEAIQKKTSFGTAKANIENYVGTLKGLDLTIDGEKVSELIVVRETGSAQLNVSITGADGTLYANAYPTAYTCTDGKSFVKGEQAAIGSGTSESTDIMYALDGIVSTRVNYFTDKNVSEPAKINGSPVVADFGYMLIVTDAQEKCLAEKGYLSEFNKYEYAGLAEMLNVKSAEGSDKLSKDDIIKNFMAKRINMGN